MLQVQVANMWRQTLGPAARRGRRLDYRELNRASRLLQQTARQDLVGKAVQRLAPTANAARSAPAAVAALTHTRDRRRTQDWWGRLAGLALAGTALGATTAACASDQTPHSRSQQELFAAIRRQDSARVQEVPFFFFYLLHGLPCAAITRVRSPHPRARVYPHSERVHVCSCSLITRWMPTCGMRPSRMR